MTREVRAGEALAPAFETLQSINIVPLKKLCAVEGRVLDYLARELVARLILQLLTRQKGWISSLVS